MENIDKVRGLSRRRFLKSAGAMAAGLGLPAGGSVEATAADAAVESNESGKALKLGLTSYTFRKFDLDNTLAMTKRVGLKNLSLKAFHLHLNSTPEQIASVAQKVRIANFNFYGVGVISMLKQADVIQAFDYAKAAGVKTIIAAPSAEMLPLIEEKVKQFNISLAIHNHGPGDKHFPTPESAYHVIDRLDRRIGLCIDIGHTVRIGADLISSVAKYGDRLLDVHMKDVTEAAPKGKEIQVGRGIIDIPSFLRALVKIKYAGIVSFEYEPEPNDPLAGLAESVGYVRGGLAMI